MRHSHDASLLIRLLMCLYCLSLSSDHPHVTVPSSPYTNVSSLLLSTQIGPGPQVPSSSLHWKPTCCPTSYDLCTCCTLLTGLTVPPTRLASVSVMVMAINIIIPTISFILILIFPSSSFAV